MIVLDTPIWVWWIHDDPQLTQRQKAWIQAHEDRGLGVRAISCWEVAKLVAYKGLRRLRQGRAAVPRRFCVSVVAARGLSARGVFGRIGRVRWTARLGVIAPSGGQRCIFTHLT